VVVRGACVVVALPKGVEVRVCEALAPGLRCILLELLYRGLCS